MVKEKGIKAAKGVLRAPYLSTLEQNLHRIIEPINPPSASAPSDSNKGHVNLVQMIENSFGSHFHERLSHAKSPVKSHFQGLFDGLDTITSVSDASNVLELSEGNRIKVIQGAHREEELIDIFNKLYYHGKLSRMIAEAIIKHPNCSRQNVEKIIRLVLSGGKLVHWPVHHEYIFRLHAANICWIRKKIPEQARALIIDCYDTVWRPALNSELLDSRVYQGLYKALIALGGKELLRNDLMDMKDVANNQLIGKLFIPLWQTSIQIRDYDFSKDMISIASELYQINDPDSIVLFIQSMSIFYSMINDNQVLRELDSTKLSEIVSIPIDTGRQLDTGLLNRLLDFCLYLETKSLGEITAKIVRNLNGTLDQFLESSQDKDKISMALVVQKLHILQKHSKLEVTTHVSRSKNVVLNDT